MVNRDLFPTPLFASDERPPIRIVEPRPTNWADSLAAFVFILRCLFRFALYSAGKKLGRKGDARALFRWMRVEVERHGILFIKAGQLAAMRRDLLPESFCDEMSLLQDSAAGFPWRYVEETLRRELKQEVAAVFSEISPVPIAAASIGQVHCAQLRGSEREVAVKVQRPYAVTSCRRDLRQVRLFARTAEFFGFWPHARWREMYEQLNQTIERETDYRYEAQSLRSMAKTLRAHEVLCPKVYRGLSSTSVLVMEFIAGVPMSDFIRASRECPARLRLWMLENQIDREKVGKKLYETHTRQVFEDNMFHGDLHPGNIFLLKQSRMALIDFGAVGTIQASTVRRYYQIFEANSKQDYLRVARLFLLLSPVPPQLTRTQLEAVQTGIVRVLETWQAQSKIDSLPYHRRSLTSAMQGIANIFRVYRIPVNWELLTVNRAEVTMDASLEHLLPSANYVELIEAYRDGAWLRKLNRLFEEDSFSRTANAILSVASSWVERGESGTEDADLALRSAVAEFVLEPPQLTPGGFAVQLAARWLLIAGILVLAAVMRMPGTTVIATLWDHALVQIFPLPFSSQLLVRIGLPLAAIYGALVLGKIALRLRTSGVRL